MSRLEAARFFQACLADPAMLARYETKPLPDLVLQARCEGFAFGPTALSGMIGEMEVWKIMTVAAEPIDASSSLWRQMWGRSRLHYIVRELWATLDEVTRLRISTGTPAGAGAGSGSGA